MALGARLSPTAGSFFTGNIGEVLVFNYALSAADRASVESYLESKWLGVGSASLNGNLPTATALQVASTGTVDLNGGNQQVASLSDSGVGGGGIVTNNGSFNSVLSVATSGSSTFSGAIKDGASGTMGLTMNGTGTQILSGANTYTGPTTISSGKLVVTSTGSLGLTSVSVANAATFAPQPGSGSLTVGSLTLNNGATVDMTDGAIGTLNLSGSGNLLKIGSAGGAAATLNFDLSSAGVDKIVDAGSATVLGVNTINFTPLTSSLTSTTYTLISATGGLSGNFQLSNGLTSQSIVLGSTTYSLSLANTGTAETLTVQIPGITSVWGGSTSTAWSTASNWSSNPAVPGAIGTTNNLDTIVFNSTSSSTNLSPIITTGRNVQSVTFDSGANAINLTGSALTLSGNGMVQATSSVSSDETVSVPLVLEGNYIFQSNSASNNALILNGNISGGAAVSGPMVVTLGGSSTGNNIIAGSISNGSATSLGVIKTGSGNWALAAANSYTGETDINQGVLNIVNGALGSTGNVVFGGGTLQYATGANQDLSAQINNSTQAVTIDTNGNNVTFGSGISSSNIAGLVKLGAGSLTLGGSNTYLGSTTVTAGAIWQTATRCLQPLR
jgi:autotransporter-associated beta strand protein